MKFLAFSSLIALSLLTRQSQGQLSSDSFGDSTGGGIVKLQDSFGNSLLGIKGSDKINEINGGMSNEIRGEIKDEINNLINGGLSPINPTNSNNVNQLDNISIDYINQINSAPSDIIPEPEDRKLGFDLGYYNIGGNNIDNIISMKSIMRNYDGTGHNLKNPNLGAKQTAFKRLCYPNYEDGIGKIWKQMPNARLVSNMVGSISGKLEPLKNGGNLLFVQFGQFLDHDFASSVGGQQNENILIPTCDKFFDPQCKGKQFFDFGRSAFDPKRKQRDSINSVTHWIDGSQLYGNDKSMADSLRTFSSGKLKVVEGNLLPRENGQFLAADPEVNQNSALIIFQTIFRREHNRICDVMLKRNPNLIDQQVYQAARNYVTGLYQHIAYDQFLPILLGVNNYKRLIGKYKYQPNVDPTLFTDFSTAAYRIGHTLVNSPFPLINANGQVIRQLQPAEFFQNPNLINAVTVDQFIHGLLRTPGKQRSLQLVEDLRSFLFNNPQRTIKIDLFSFNVQRGRDHGICTINDARERVGLSRKEKFADLFADPKKVEIMQKLYQKTDKVDLWLGILGQPSAPGAVMGQLGIRMNALQFRNTRNADRLWYENVYPKIVINQIKSTTFSDIIQRNSGVRNLGKNAFRKF